MARSASNNISPNTVQKSTESSQIRDKNNSHIYLKSEIIQQNNNCHNNPTIECHQVETIQQNISKISTNNLKEIDNLRVSLEKLIVSHQVLPKLPILKKVPKSILKTATNGEQQLLFQDQVKPLVNTAKNRIAHLMMIAQSCHRF